MRNIGENEITNMGGDFNYVNCECITDVSGEPETNLFTTNYNEYDSTSGIYGFKKLVDSLVGKKLTATLTDKDTSVDMSGIYFGYTANGLNADGGHSWIMIDGLLESLRETRNLRYFSFFPKNQTVFNKIISRFDIKIELEDL